ncbi:hypothetical protein DFH06DRAFT_1187072 [Mycena polygramma]|nr:hypothetical protein DFH06DRAFT_1187072 [Mycena polygramma]
MTVQPLSSPEGEVLPQPAPPIHMIPVELLAEIMALSLTPCIGKQGYEIPSTTADVLVLCRVCSFWRQVASTTPRLWVVQSFPMVQRRVTSSAGTELFLKRSAQLPISVYVDPPMYCRQHIELPPMVINAAPRWKTFQMLYDGGTAPLDAIALAQIRPGSLIKLEKVVLKWGTPKTWPGPELDVFMSAPRLRDVTLQLPRLTNILPMPWAQLTRLSLSYESPQACLEVLVQCRSLVSAHFKTEQWLESDSPIGGTGFLGHLEELNIDMHIRSTGEHLGPFLRRLRLPNLKALSLSLHLFPWVDEYFVSWITPALAFFLTRSPNLDRLELNDLYLAEADVVPDILQLTPNLTSFALGNGPVDDDFFDALRYAETDVATLVPKLEKLSLIGVGDSMDFEEASFAQMMRSRWWSDDERLAMPNPPRVARMKCLTFWDEDIQYNGTTTLFTTEMIDTMEAYQSQGLDLSVCNCFYRRPSFRPVSD